jgi:hypothetical protein
MGTRGEDSGNNLRKPAVSTADCNVEDEIE